MKSGLGEMKTSEMRVLIIFLLTAMLWITRDIINDIPGLEGLSDPGIAMLCGLALFLTPSKSTDQNLLEWKDAQEGVPWGVLLLFGGGLSLAAAAQSTGDSAVLARWALVACAGCVRLVHAWHARLAVRLSGLRLVPT